MYDKNLKVIYDGNIINMIRLIEVKKYFNKYNPDDDAQLKLLERRPDRIRITYIDQNSKIVVITDKAQKFKFVRW